MGIPSYFSYIIRNHSNIIRNRAQLTAGRVAFQSLYMDCNSIIYDAVRAPSQAAPTTDESIVAEVVRKIDQYIAAMAPTNIVCIAFDGVAPFAKMNQQRVRRYKTGYLAKIDADFRSEGKSADKSVCKSVCAAWNTSAITPGTAFMDLLSRRVKAAFEGKEAKYGVKQMRVSTSQEPGEGEHKMFQHMRDHANQRETIAVYGLDSDLIMLSLFHCFACENIFIFREAPEFAKSVLPKDAHIAPNELLFLDGRALAASILKEMGCAGADARESRSRIYDYIFMCFLLGNDFLPHFPALNIRTHGNHTLLDLYQTHIGRFPDRHFISTETSAIQWRWVKLFVGELAKLEHPWLVKELAERDKLAKRMRFSEKTPEDRQQAFDNIPIIYRGDEKYICPDEKGWEERYYETAFAKSTSSTAHGTPANTAHGTPSSTAHGKMSEPEIRYASIQYIEGLEWVFRYYTEGCPHWRWKYDAHYPPLLRDLVKYIPNDNGAAVLDLAAGARSQPFHPSTQLLYVIPPWNHAQLLPAKARKLAEHTPDRFVQIHDLRFQWLFCRYFWESHAVLPEIGLAQMEEWNKAFHNHK